MPFAVTRGVRPQMMDALDEHPGGFRVVVDTPETLCVSEMLDSITEVADAVTLFTECMTGFWRTNAGLTRGCSGFLFDNDKRLIARTVPGASSVFLLFIFGILKPSLCTEDPLYGTSPNTLEATMTLMGMRNDVAEDGGSPTKLEIKAALEKFAVSSAALPKPGQELEGARPPCPSIFLDSNSFCCVL